MREGRWLNAAAIVTWLICGLSQAVAIAQGVFGGWPAAVWGTAYALYGVALLVLVGTGLRRGRYSPLLFITVQIVAALIVITLSLQYRYGTNSTPALLVIIAATLPYLSPSTVPSAQVTLTPAWIWSIIADADIDQHRDHLLRRPPMDRRNHVRTHHGRLHVVCSRQLVSRAQ